MAYKVLIAESSRQAYCFERPNSAAHDVKTRTIVVSVVLGAAALAALGFWRHPLPFRISEIEAPASSSSTVPKPASASSIPNSIGVGGLTAQQRAVGVAPGTSSSPNPRYAKPDEIETQLGQFFAAQQRLEIMSLSSIDCNATQCQLALTGSEVNPRYVDAYSDLFHKLLSEAWNAFRVRSGGLGTHEIAPGAREYVISFEYQPLVDLSADPLIAARQYAACAAAWRRATENPTPDDIVRGYLEEAERNIALAASVLGEAEAARIATETRGGPVIRICF